MVSINYNEIYLNKVFKRAKDTQFDYIENSRDMSSAKPLKIKGWGRSYNEICTS